MTTLSREQISNDWASMLSQVPTGVSQRVQELAQQHAATLASHFYQQMLQDPFASTFLSHEQVRDRLHSSMQQWVISLFSLAQEEEIAAVVAQQMKIGEIHARINVPVHLVLRGARSLKEKFHSLLQADTAIDSDRQMGAVRLITDLVDLAMEVMSHAYASSHDRNSRAEEAYRLFAVAQNVATEKERQRAALLDWENQLMFDLAVGLTASQLPRIGSAEFGLWFRHKGAHAFQGTPETDLILDAMQRIDEVLLPLFAQPGDPATSGRVQHLRELREQSKSIGYHLERLFEQTSELEAGRDVLTRLLNRKFLPVVLSKEVGYARRTGTQFAILAIDIDHFKTINDNHGHEAGDIVLQQLAALLYNNSRSGDYLFRLGGEEFLVVLVDVDQAGALKAAENLREQVAREVFRLPHEKTLKVTTSIGLALHNGHPDYQRALRRADEALYQAKHTGRNRVVIAGDSAGSAEAAGAAGQPEHSEQLRHNPDHP